MKFDNFFKTKRMVVGCLSAAALAAVACADGRGVPTSPSASAAGPGLLAAAAGNEGNVRPPVAQSLLASSRRSGALQVTKECSEYTGQVGSFCTITSSNVKAIEVGSRIVYGHAPGATSLDSDIVLDTPGTRQQRRDRALRAGFRDRYRTVHVLGRDREVQPVRGERKRLVPGRTQLGLEWDVQLQSARLSSMLGVRSTSPVRRRTPRRFSRHDSFRARFPSLGSEGETRWQQGHGVTRYS
jgi:hypothetical protein